MPDLPKLPPLSGRIAGIGSAILVMLLVLIIAGSQNTAKTMPHADLVRIPHKSLLASPEGAQSATSTTTQSTESAASSTTPSAKSTSSKQPLQEVPTSLTVPAIVPAPLSAETIQARHLVTSGGKLLASLVNIVCVSGDPSLPSVSGSGVMIDSRGIILTASHVAQLFLLQDYLGTSKMQCFIRTGSPARKAYTAEPIYVSKSWIQANPNTLTDPSPSGSGQYDVALLAITGTATSTPLPGSFPSIPLTTTDAQLNDRVAIGSYGAQYLTRTELNYSLYPILVFGSIQDRYTYNQNTVDVISVVGTAASQEGSSGGGIANANGELIGTITTSSITGSFNGRQLNAITPLHARNSFATDMGRNLDATLRSETLSQLIADFAEQSKQLGAVLVKNISSK